MRGLIIPSLAQPLLPISNPDRADIFCRREPRSFFWKQSHPPNALRIAWLQLEGKTNLNFFFFKKKPHPLWGC